MKPVEPGEPGSLEAAVEVLEQVRPTRLEWSYTWRNPEHVAALRDRVPVYVAALNTIMPNGRASSFEGEPVVAPWMKNFSRPGHRPTYICQNNPDDVQSRIEQARDIISQGITDVFQFDDWYCNAQMIVFGNPCFCEYCQREFAIYLGFDHSFDYHNYLRGRGVTHTTQLLEMSKRGDVPLWDDYVRFQQQTVTRFFRRLRIAMDRELVRETQLSVNASVAGFGGRIDTVLPFVTYFNGETHDFSPAALLKLAQASRDVGRMQVVSFFPRVPADRQHDEAFVASVRQGIAVCYCLGLLPLFPYDVYAGSEPRWYGTWDEYREPYEYARAHADWLDDYEWSACQIEEGRVSIRSQHMSGGGELEHTVMPDGAWATRSIG